VGCEKRKGLVIGDWALGIGSLGRMSTCTEVPGTGTLPKAFAGGVAEAASPNGDLLRLFEWTFEVGYPPGEDRVYS
jgi:hypothetical protein